MSTWRIPMAARDVGCVQRARAAEWPSARNWRGSSPCSTEITPYGPHHVDIDDFEDAGGRASRDRCREVRTDACSMARAPALGGDGHPTAEQGYRVQPAEHEVGVGDGRPLAAAAIRRPGPAGLRRSSGRLSAGRRDPPRRWMPPPAPMVWMSSVRARTGKPPISRTFFFAGMPVLDQADIGGGATHVEGDEVRRRPDCRGRDSGCADDAAGRTGEEGVDREPPHGRRAITAPPFDCITCGAQRIAERMHAPFETLQVAVDDRHQAGVHRRRWRNARTRGTRPSTSADAQA